MLMLPNMAQGVTKCFNEYENCVNHHSIFSLHLYRVSHTETKGWHSFLNSYISYIKLNVL